MAKGADHGYDKQLESILVNHIQEVVSVILSSVQISGLLVMCGTTLVDKYPATYFLVVVSCYVMLCLCGVV